MQAQPIERTKRERHGPRNGAELFIAVPVEVRLHASFPNAVLAPAVLSRFQQRFDTWRWIQAELLCTFPAIDPTHAHAGTEARVQVELPQTFECFVVVFAWCFRIPSFVSSLACQPMPLEPTTWSVPRPRTAPSCWRSLRVSFSTLAPLRPGFTPG